MEEEIDISDERKMAINAQVSKFMNHNQFSSDSEKIVEFIKEAVQIGYNPGDPIVVGCKTYSNLVACLAEGKFNVFKEVCELCPDVDLSDAYVKYEKGKEIPLLHYLAQLSYADYEPANEAIEFLLQHGYDPNKTDDEGYNALVYAKRAANLTSAVILLKYGTDPFAKSTIREEMVDSRFYDGSLKGNGFVTIYDSMFDKNGDYYDFVYRSHDKSCKKDPSESYIYDTDLLEQRLEDIRALCKPEFEGKMIDPSRHKIQLFSFWRFIESDGYEYFVKVSSNGEVRDIALVGDDRLKKIEESSGCRDNFLLEYDSVHGSIDYHVGRNINEDFDPQHKGLKIDLFQWKEAKIKDALMSARASRYIQELRRRSLSQVRDSSELQINPREKEYKSR